MSNVSNQYNLRNKESVVGGGWWFLSSLPRQLAAHITAGGWWWPGTMEHLILTLFFRYSTISLWEQSKRENLRILAPEYLVFIFKRSPYHFFFILLKLFKIYHLDSAYLWSSAFAQNCQSPSVFHNGSKIKHNLEKLRAQAYVFKVRESKQSKYLLTNM